MELLERERNLPALTTAFNEATTGSGRVGASAAKPALARLHSSSTSRRNRTTPRPLSPLHDSTPQLSGDQARLLATETNRAMLFAVFLAAMRHQTRLAVIVFEDVHWADEATLDLLKFIGRHVQRIQAVIVITYHDDEPGAHHPLHLLLGDLATSIAMRCLTLEPLSIEVVRTQGRAVEPIALPRQTGCHSFAVAER